MAVTTLCKQCALCCKGCLFSYVRIDRKEKRKIEKLGMPTRKISKNDYAFDQPCPGLLGEACTIYAARPEKCAGYHCLIAKQVMVGIIDVKDGEKLISVVKKQLKWFSRQTKFLSVKNRDGLSPYDFLRAYLKKAHSLHKKGKLSKYDQMYAKKVFEHLELIDRYFRETTLLGKYATLTRMLHEDPPP